MIIGYFRSYIAQCRRKIRKFKSKYIGILSYNRGPNYISKRNRCSANSIKLPNVSSDIITHPEVDFSAGRQMDSFYLYEKNMLENAVMHFLQGIELFCEFGSWTIHSLRPK